MNLLDRVLVNINGFLHPATVTKVNADHAVAELDHPENLPAVLQQPAADTAPESAVDPGSCVQCSQPVPSDANRCPNCGRAQ